MKIGLIDVDGHGFPNLALMRISAYHKQLGDDVSWWWSDFIYYDIVYMSKVFGDAYTKDKPEPFNCGKVVKGGTGYAIKLVDGKEVYNKQLDAELPEEIERCKPDYSIYPQYNFAVAMTSRGCPRGCSFCHVAGKEGKHCHKVANVSDFWCGQKKIAVCDPNILACKQKAELLEQYASTKATIDFNQGLDIRLITQDDINALKRIRLANLHFAWDDPKIDLRDKFKQYADLSGGEIKVHGHLGTVYCLTNFGNYSVQEHKEMALDRIYFLRDLGFTPYLMIYNKPNAPRELREMQRWCNNPRIIFTIKRFEDFDRRLG